MNDHTRTSEKQEQGFSPARDEPSHKQASSLARRALRAVPFLPGSGRDIELVEEKKLRSSSGMSGYFISFILFFVLPAAACTAYFVFLASNQYYSETRFAVRKASFAPPDEKKPTATSTPAGAIPSLAGQDAYIITSYIRSRSIITELSKTINIRAIFTRPEADFWAKLKTDASEEELLAYWKDMVTTNIDGPSGIVTVGIRTFRQQDSFDLANAITKASEKLANDVSARIRADAVERASVEVRRSEALVVDALNELKIFRNNQGYIDPGSAALSQSKLLLQLLAEKIQMQNDLFVATRAMSENAPTLKALKNRLIATDQQIDNLRAKLTNQSGLGTSIASSLTQYEQLDLKRIFAEKMYSLSQDGLERSKQIADSQSIYVSVFVRPGLPDESTFPKRMSLSLILALSFLSIWGIFALLVAAIDDHQF